MNSSPTSAGEPPFRLAHAPIVEAVVDIECDMPAGFDLGAMEAPAREAFHEQYPKVRHQLIQEHQIRQEPEHPVALSVRRELLALQFLHDDEKQLVQVRTQGFSFNRLAPYTTLDDYLPEIERTWRSFVELTAPAQIRVIRLRYINRMLLPMSGGRLELDQYLELGPRLPDEERLSFAGFLYQYVANETDTGNQANIVLTTQPAQGEHLPVIFDITAERAGPAEPLDSEWLRQQITSLRSLKNRIFRNTLTDECLKLFQQP